jgi:4-amino-4-deoxy-L-arabinose transferase-like glycosyltransferase
MPFTRTVIDRIKSNPICIVIIGAFFIRLPLLFVVNPLALPDSRVYHKLALNIIAGFGFGGPIKPYVYRPPLYSGLLALVYTAFGPHTVAAIILQAVLSAATCYFVYRIALTLWGRRVAMVAAGLWAICPDIIIFSNLVLTETLYMFLAAVVLWLLVRFRDNWWGIISAGAFLGLLSLTRGAALAFVPLVIVWMLFVRRMDYKKVLAFSAVFLAVITPWLIRNYRITGEFQLIDCNSGVNIYLGNHYKGKGEYYPIPKSENPFVGKQLNPWEKNKTAYGLAARNAYEHPIGTLKIIGLKAAYVIFPSGEKLYLKKGIATPRLLWILLSALFFEVIAFGVALHLAKKGKSGNTDLLWLYIGSVVAVMIIVFFGERFRMTTYPAAIPIAAAGLLYLFEKGETRRKITALVILVISQITAGTFILLFRPNVVERTISFLQKLT